MLNKLMTIAMSFGALLLFDIPAQAQYSLNEQPVVGPIHAEEARLQMQLNDSFQRGLIDSLELANLTRNLDAIRCHEEKFRMSTHGMTPKKQARIEKQLCAFSADLNKRCNEKLSYSHS
jgi:hypothetical protein